MNEAEEKNLDEDEDRDIQELVDRDYEEFYNSVAEQKEKDYKNLMGKEG